MKNNILFLKPYLVDKIWGGKNLVSYGVSGETKIGEAWIISGIAGKSSVLLNEEYFGVNLAEFYQDHRAFFNNYESQEYPLLLKLLDCQDDLSVQVHPTEEYVKNHKELATKTEAWYILDAIPHAQIVYGHHAKTFEELCTLVNEKKWDKLLNFVNVQKGDVFYVPSGTLHALKKGLVILEIQQSSQSTFRLYDYERDQHERTLDVQQSIENTIVPFVKPQLEQLDSELLTTPFFSISEIHNQGTKTYDFSYAQWLQCFVVDGSGQIENIPLKKGTTFIIGNNDLNFQLTGNLHIILTYIRR